jgi:hypothetical protein
MRNVLRILLFIAAVVGLQAIDFVTGVTVTGNLRNDATGQGMQFTNSTGGPITITELGAYVQSGNSQSHDVRIYETNVVASPVASVTLNFSGAPAGQFLYGTLSSPYIMAANSSIWVMKTENPGGDLFNAQINGPPVVRNTITTTDIGSTQSAFFNGSIITNAGGSSTSMGPVAFRYTSPVPGWTKNGTVYTTDGSFYSAKSAIADASTGDTVEIPATTWTLGGPTTLNIAKVITVMGAGPGQTVFNISTSTPNWAAGGAVQISAAATFGGVTMNQPGGTGNNTTAIVATSPGWRITDIEYNSATFRGYFIYASAFGLLDTYEINGGGGNDEWVFIRGPDNAWTTAETLGTANAVYLEDGVMNLQGYFDANSNAKVVARFNTVNPVGGTIKFDVHGYSTNQSPAQSGRSIEAYNNAWITSSGTSWEIRGGSGRIFNNKTVGTQAFYLTDYGYLTNATTWGNYQTPSNNPLFQQIGRGIMQATDVEDLVAYQRVQISFLGDTNWQAIGAPGGATTGTQFTATGAGSGTGQAYVPSSSPMYLWGNKQSGGAPWERFYKPIGTASVFLTNTVGYLAGATSITLASRTTAGSGAGRIGVGDYVMFAGDTSNRYRVTSGLPTNSTSGTITIASPGLINPIAASAVSMTIGPLTAYQGQTGNMSATFTEPNVVTSNDAFYADAGFDTNTGVTVGTAAEMALATPTNKFGFWVKDEGSWNRKFSGTIAATAIQTNYWCEIVTVGTTTWSAIGGPSSPNVGDQFQATGAGTGTGTVKAAQGRLYVGNGSSWVLNYEPYIYPHPMRSGAPAFVSATINEAGTTLTLEFSESVTVGAGGSGGVTVSPSGGAATATYTSGSPGTTFVYNLNRTINSIETVSTSYTQPGNGIESTATLVDLASYAGQPVTNNSAAGSTINATTVNVTNLVIGP